MFCVECGKKGSKGKFCAHCGAKLEPAEDSVNSVDSTDQEAETRPSSDSAASKGKSSVLPAVVGTALLSTLVVGLVFGSQNASGPPKTVSPSSPAASTTPKATQTAQGTEPDKPTYAQLKETCEALKKPVEIMAIPMTYDETDHNWPLLYAAVGVIEEEWIYDGLPVPELRSAILLGIEEQDSSAATAEILDTMLKVQRACSKYGVEIDLIGQTFERQGIAQKP